LTIEQVSLIRASTSESTSTRIRIETSLFLIHAIVRKLFRKHIHQNKDWNALFRTIINNKNIFRKHIHQNKDWNKNNKMKTKHLKFFRKHIHQNKDWNTLLAPVKAWTKCLQKAHPPE